jgi:integrase
MAKKTKRGNNEGTITRRKDGRWEARISLGRDATGKVKRITLYGKTRQEVADKLTKTLHDKQQGTVIAPHKLTLGEWLETWLQEYKRQRIRPSTFDSYEIIVKRYVIPVIGHIALRDLRPDHLQGYYNEKAQHGLAASTIQLHHRIVSNALAQAEKNQLVMRNVCRLTELPRQPRREMRTLTIKQVTAQLLSVLQGDRLYAAFLTFFMTGLRRGELLGLRWQDVDLTAGILQVRQILVRIYNRGTQGEGRKTRLAFHEPKTEKSRRSVPIPEACLAALKSHKAHQAEEKILLGPGYQDNGLVFAQAHGGPIDPRSMDRYFAQALKRADLPAIRLHDARHTFATWMLEQGVSPKVVQTMLGHSSIRMTLDVYSHVSLELEKQAAATLNAALTGAR